MARIEKLIPHILEFESRIGPAALQLPLPRMFDAARRCGFVNDPNDAGGATMCGITLATYRTYRQRLGYAGTTVDDLKSISFEIWKAVLKEQYWDRWRGDEIGNQSVAELLVDWVWTSGRYGITIPQRVLGVKPDGIVGSKTISALNAREPAEFFAAIIAERKAYIDRICISRPVNNKYKRGWLRRLNAITFRP